jgi:hypothetical protein
LGESKNLYVGPSHRRQWSLDDTLWNVYLASLFVNFGAKSFYSGGKFVKDKNGTPQEENFVFSNLYKLHNLCILMDFYLVHLRGYCSRFA